MLYLCISVCLCVCMSVCSATLPLPACCMSVSLCMSVCLCIQRYSPPPGMLPSCDRVSQGVTASSVGQSTGGGGTFIPVEDDVSIPLFNNIFTWFRYCYDVVYRGFLLTTREVAWHVISVVCVCLRRQLSKEWT